MKRDHARGRILWLLCLVAVAACGKKNGASQGTENEYKDITKTFDDSEPPPGARKPVEGASLEKLSEADRQRFEGLVDSLPSPCGKAHSLRTSRNTDAACARARFAVDFVIASIGDGAADDEVRELYASRYKADKPLRTFKVGEDVPHVGPTDARIVMVEFFDYGCPACAEFRTQLEDVVTAYPTDVVLYYKEYPLAVHEQSKGAAQAALAAAKQGKHHEMHELLFQNQHSHSKADLLGYARKLGLDQRKFEQDFAAAEAQVNAEKAEGDAAEVSGTPTLFINGRLYEWPSWAKYLKMWIDEELAVNR